MKTANQILSECGINTMSLNDEFNTQLFHAMEEYAHETNKEKDKRIHFIEEENNKWVKIHYESLQRISNQENTIDGLKKRYEQMWFTLGEILKEYDNGNLCGSTITQGKEEYHQAARELAKQTPSPTGDDRDCEELKKENDELKLKLFVTELGWADALQKLKSK